MISDPGNDSQGIRPRPRVPKGNRPWFLGNPHIERVLSMTMAVATEVSVLHDRIDTLERVASDKKGMFTLDDIGNYTPSPEVHDARERWRKEYLDRIMRIMLEEIGKAGDEREKTFQDFVKSLND